MCVFVWYVCGGVYMLYLCIVSLGVCVICLCVLCICVCIMYVHMCGGMDTL